MQKYFLFTALILWVAIFLFFVLKKHGKSNDAIIEDFIEKERAANSARRHAIDEGLFFTPDLDLLPGDGTPAYKKVTETAGHEMLRFKQPVTNAELKLAYGPSQLEDIARLEENYYEYIRALIYWAEEVYEKGAAADALKIIEYTMELGSDFKRSYTLAADIYAAEKDEEKLSGLLIKTEGMAFTDENMKKSVVKYIMDRKGAFV